MLSLFTSNDKEDQMAFSKRGVAVTPPQHITIPPKEAEVLQAGDERDGKIWDGTQWVEKAEWLRRQDQR